MPHILAVARTAAIVVLAGMLALSIYGTVVPAPSRCGLPGAVGCPGGLFGVAVAAAGAGEQWFDVSMYDWGFWIIDSTTGANVSGTWTIFEGYTIHINATSLKPDAAIGGTAYHGLGVEINATGQQLLSLAAPVGTWVSASFVAPTTAYYHQHIWCTIECGPGHSSQQEHNLNIVPAIALPHAALTSNVSVGAAPFSVGFTGSGSSGSPPYNLTWNFGDGSPDAYGATAVHTYTLGGIYYASLTVTDAKGNPGSASTAITVLSNAVLNASLRAGPAGGPAPFGTTFSTIAHGGTPPYSYLWSYGDGPAQGGANLSRHVFGAPGVYAVAVNITDATGVRARAITSVVVTSPGGSLAVTVTGSPPNGTTPLTTTLSAKANGGSAPYTFSWVLGDGGTAAGSNVSHLYGQTGLYEATVFVGDAAGHTGFGTLPIAVTAPSTGGGGGGDGGGNGSDTLPVTPAASGSLTVRPLLSPSGGAPPLAVTAIASVENGTGLNESVSWTFGDGTVGSGLVASHVFGATGTYSVTATVRDSAGNTGTATTLVHVLGPSAALVLNATAGDTPFSLLGGVTLMGGNGTWQPATWSWGDGTTSTGFLANHSYALNLSGPFTVRASATDAAGHTVSASGTVVLTGPPVATLQVALPTAHGLPAMVTFTLNVSGGTGGYPAQPLWSFGDQTSARGPSVESHSYNRTGHFLVIAETNDSAGRFAVASAWVNLSSAVPLPPLSGGGGSAWVFKGVANPAQASLILMGLVGVTGLAFLVRKQRRKKPTPPAAAGRPATARPRAPAGRP